MAKSKYESHVLPRLDEIKAWAENGVSEKQIAENLKIAYSTLMAYKNTYAALSDRLKTAQNSADRAVENALFKRAVGYAVTEVTQERKANPQTGELSLVTTKTVTKYIAGNVTAQLFWLKNRNPERWKDKPDDGGAAADDAQGVIIIPEATQGDAEEKEARPDGEWEDEHE